MTEAPITFEFDTDEIGQHSALTPDVCEALEKLRQQLAAENPIVVNDPDW